MELIINILDTISFFTIAIAFIIFLSRWKSVSHPGIKFFFLGLLTLILFYHLCNVFERTGVNNAFDIYGDIIGILIPIMWGSLFYAFLESRIENELKNRDVKLQELFNEAPIGYHELDIEGKITQVNHTELEMLGYTAKEMLGHYVWDFVVEREISHQAFMDKIKGIIPPSPHFERTYRHKDGTSILVLLNDRILLDDNGQITGIRVTIQDITERKRVEDQLKKNEEFSRTLFEYNPIETIVVNTKGEIVSFNLTKKKSGDRLPNIGDIMYKDYANKHELDMYSELMECIRLGKTKTFSEQKYGSKFLSITISPFPQGAILTSQDTTERKKAEEEIKKLSSAVEQSNDGIVICDLEENLIYTNNSFAKMHGYSPKEIIKMKVLDLHNDEQKKEVKKKLQQIRTKGEWIGELYHTKKDGTVFPTQMSITLLKDDKGKVTSMLAICRDISEHKFVEEALKTSEERYRELWDDAPVAYHILDKKGIITSVNHTEAKMFGYKPEEMIGKPIFDFILSEQKEEAKKRFLLKIAGKSIPEAKDRIYVTKDGKNFHVNIDDIFEYDSNDKITSVRTTMIDITDRKKAEEELEKSFQKLKRAFEETITALASAVEIRDLYTSGHQQKTTQLACAIAEEMKLPQEQIDAVRMAGLIHDVGKIAVPAEILGKPSKLTDIEMDLVRTHSKMGYDILKTVEFPWPVAKIVLQHHERINGSGYPDRLKGDDIMLEARILSVADVVEAMTAYRPYHEAFGIDIALEEIFKNKGVLYDPQVADACIRLFKEKGFKFTS